jgi:putative transposase
MKPENSLNHTKWECKYHIVWIPKYRKKSIYKDLREYLGVTLKDLALQKECKIEEGHLMPDHVHILISIPPKYSVSQVVGLSDSWVCVEIGMIPVIVKLCESPSRAGGLLIRN